VEKINEFLDNLYSNTQNMMYFYIILGVIALFFIILIIITLIKSSKETKRHKKVASTLEIDNQEIVAPEKNKEQEKQEDKLSETKIFNSNLMDKEEPQDIVNTLQKEEEKVFDDIKKEEEKKNTEHINMSFSEPSVYLEKEEIKNEKNEEFVPKENNIFDKKDSKMTISELINEEKPSLDSVSLFSLDESKPINAINAHQDKTLDVDAYLFNKDYAFSQEEPQVVNPELDGSQQRVVISNEELKERIAKLKAEKEAAKLEENKEAKLEDIMKAVGLEDTMVIPKLKDEEQVLGK